MLSSSRTAITLAILATALAGNVHAQTGRTRAEVQAELAEAIRAGNMPVGGEIGFMPRELASQHGGAVTASTTTRAEVLEQLKQAQRTGDVLAGGESGLRLNELHPDLYPARAVAAGKTRAEVQAELQEALRTGDVVANGESGLLQREVNPQQYAKARVVPRDSMEASVAPALQVR